MSGNKDVRVLLVDDDLAILQASSAELSGHFDIVTAHTGEGALELIRQGGIDILVADVEMPGMTGLQLVATVKQEKPEVIRIVLTGSNSLQVALEAINSGEVFRFLTKPWKTGELTATVLLAGQKVRERKSRHSPAHAKRVAELQKVNPEIAKLELDDDGAVWLNEEQVLAFADLLPPELHALLKS